MDFHIDHFSKSKYMFYFPLLVLFENSKLLDMHFCIIVSLDLHKLEKDMH